MDAVSSPPIAGWPDVLTLLFEQEGGMAAIITPEGCIESVNQTLLTQSGLTQKAVVGRHITALPSVLVPPSDAWASAYQVRLL